jgi:citrate synthase
MFTQASDSGIDAEQFAKDMQKQQKLIMGIGHRVKANNDSVSS